MVAGILRSHVCGVNMDPTVSTRMEPERTRYHHGDLRNALLEASLRLIAADGVEAFSLREAAREVGVSPNAAYRHFADKTALLAALAGDGFARMADAMERRIARLPGPKGTPAHAVAQVLTTGEGYVDFAVRHPAQFRLMFGPWLQAAGCCPEPGQAGRSPYQILADALDDLAAAGVIGPAGRAGGEIFAWSAVHGLAALLVDGLGAADARERRAAIAQVTRKALRGLGADPALLGPEPDAPDSRCWFDREGEGE